MSEDIIITMIFPANVANAWPQVSKVLSPAVERVGTHDIEDIRRDVMSGKCQLWVQWNKKEGVCEAALISEFQNFPKGLFLNIWLYAAAEGKEPAEEDFQNNIFSFAVANECMGIRDEGRKGWSKRLEHLPIKCENTVRYLLIKDLMEAT